MKSRDCVKKMRPLGLMLRNSIFPTGLYIHMSTSIALAPETTVRCACSIEPNHRAIELVFANSLRTVKLHRRVYV